MNQNNTDNRSDSCKLALARRENDEMRIGKFSALGALGLVVLGVATVPNAQAGVTYYNSFATFSAANPGLVTETFAAIDPGSDGYNTYSLPINATNNPGLQTGFSISSSGGSMFVGGPGALGIGNTTTDVFGDYYGSDETLSFTTNPTAVGFQLFGYSSTETETVDVYGASGLLSSTTVITDLTPVYLGLASDQAITSITLTPGAGTDTVGIANLSFGSASVPEPASLALLGTGLAAFGLQRRRREAS